MIPKSMNKVVSRTLNEIIDKEWVVNEKEFTEKEFTEKEFTMEEFKDDDDNISKADTEEMDMDSIEYDTNNSYLQHDVEELYNSYISEGGYIENFAHINDNYDNSYVYEGLELLKQDLEDYLIYIQENSGKIKVHICAYHVNNYHKYPFLEFFLLKENHENKENDETFYFPSFKYENSVNVLVKSMAAMNILCFSYFKKPTYAFKGYMNDENNLYLFFDSTDMKVDRLNMRRSNDMWMVTIDEIINKGKVCNFNVSSSIVNFFKMNDKLCFLNNMNGIPYEIPTTVFFGCVKSEMNFMANFGKSPADFSGILGKYYYFTDYQHAVKMSGMVDENNEVGGIIRCGLFLGKMKVPLNNPNDCVDESLTTKTMLLNCHENDTEYTNIKLLMRVSDRDGLWTQTYDSVYLGRIELDDGSFYEEYPLWVVKEYDQHVMLSSHLIDKKTTDRDWSKNNNYYIA